MSTQGTEITQGRFAVDSEGFRDQQRSREPFRLVQELVANGFDEDTTTRVDAHVSFDEKKGRLIVKVIDDGDGFERVQDVYTLFSASSRLKDPTKRGRFGLGERFLGNIHVVGGVSRVICPIACELPRAQGPPKTVHGDVRLRVY